MKPRRRRVESEATKEKRRATVQANIAAGKLVPWKRGQSGNKAGMPKSFRELVNLARTHTTDAINKLAWLMKNANDQRVQAYCADLLLDRGWGKPPQALIAKIMDDSDKSFGDLAREMLPQERINRAFQIAQVLNEVGAFKNAAALNAEFEKINGADPGAQEENANG